MAIDTAGTPRASFELKSALLPVVAIVLKTPDVQTLAIDLALRLAKEPDFFDKDPVLIDLALLREADPRIDFSAVVALLRQCRTLPVAVRGGSPTQMKAAYIAGLIAAPEPPPTRPEPPAPTPTPTPVPQEPPQPPSPVRETVREVIVPGGQSTVVVDKPLRSGQQVYARGADLVVLAAVSFGAEVIADGNIHVYAPLRGRVIAGARGDTSARIFFSSSMEPQLVSIAGIYRVYEAAVPATAPGRAVQVRLDGEKLLVEQL